MTGASTVTGSTRAIGGVGGDVQATQTGSGSDGGGASATANVATSSATNGGFADARTYGGTGGRGSGVDKMGGAGGIASATTATASGKYARANIVQTGGAGGAGVNGAGGGAGAASALTDAVSGAANGGYLRLQQYARGGAGGNSSAGVAGNGAAGSSALTFNDVATNGGKANYLSLISDADGGQGGTGKTVAGKGGTGQATVSAVGAAATLAVATAEGGGGGNIYYSGAASGGAGGTATGAATASTNSVTEMATARTNANGGAGGSARSAGKVAGAGGVASDAKATASGHSAYAVVNQVGGAGGTGFSGANGGAGASSTITDAVTGTTTGGSLELRQNADGGTGGYSTTGSAGAAGAATSNLTFNDETANATDASTVFGRTAATGGAGGSSASGGAGKGGEAKSAVAMTGVNVIRAYSYATGGRGGYVSSSQTGNGGNATSTAAATSTRASGYSRATANASAYGGVGAVEGTANATSSATTAMGQLATASARAGGRSGQAQSTASTTASGLVTNVSSMAQAQVGSTASAQSMAQAFTGFPGGFDSSWNSYSYVTALPDASTIGSALSGNSKVDTVLGTSLATVLGGGVQGANYASDATGNRTYKSTVTWSLNTVTLSGDLILGLLDFQSLGTGFTSLTLNVTVEGVTKANKGFSAAGLASAQTFFDNNTINLGDVAQDSDLTVVVNYTLLGNAVNSGFGMSYVLGTTNNEPDTTPPPQPAAPDLVSYNDSGTSTSDDLTNITVPTFVGTAEANGLVNLFDGAINIGSAKADVAGNWLIVSSKALSDGVHDITVTATDAAKNVSAASAALKITVDTAGPVLATAPDLTAGSDSGSSATDNLTKTVRPTFSGTAEAKSTVTLVDSVLGNLGTTVADAGGNWSITAGLDLEEGVHSVTAFATDLAGNAGASSPALAITIDTTAPGAPATPDLTAASDSGTSKADDVTNIKVPTFTGTAAANVLVTLLDGAIVIGTATASGAGVWTIKATSLTDGVHAISATATDAAGNVSAASAALSVTIDSTVPGLPTALDLVVASDTGTSSTDNLTNDSTPTITGKAEVGSTVNLFDGATQVGSAKANVSGNWTITTSALADGARSLRARAVDVAGNSSALSGILAVVIDTAAPSTPATPDLLAASDSGASPTDDITSDATPTFTGKTEVNATVNLFDGATQIGSTKADGAGVWTITTGTLLDGAHAISVTATDAAGNISTKSGTLAVTTDTVAPLTPATPDLAAASDTGASDSDNLTNDQTPTFTGTAEANAAITLFEGLTIIGSGVADGSGNWSITLAEISAGIHLVSAMATDTAGNSSVKSAEVSVTIDNAAPTAPGTPDMAAASDTGTSNSDNITKTTAPSFSGKAEAGAKVTLFAGATQVGSATADGGGAWTIVSSTLAAGDHSITAKTTDLAGNVSAASPALVVTIDTSSAVPTGLDLQNSSDSGASNTDNITNVTTPVFLGKGEIGATVSLQEGAVVLGTAKVNATGNWSIKTSVLSNGAHTVRVRQTDVAGNISIFSTTLTVTIDNIAPASPVLGKVTTSAASGTAEVGVTVVLFDGATQIGTTTADGGGLWSIPVVLGAGNHALSAKATDVAGNLSPASSTSSIVMGTAGADVLFAAGPDLSVGAAGNDIYLVDHAGDVATDAAGEGFDTVYASVGYTLPTTSEIEFLIANAGPVGVALTGNAFANTIFGGAGDDTIAGAGGADMVFGGVGADVFALLALADSTVDLAGQDTIGDFSALAGDLIGLAALDADSGTGGDQAFTFIGAAAFSAAGQVRAEVVGGMTVVSGNVNADLGADFAVRLNGSHTLGGANFVL